MLSKPAIADIPAQGRERTAELLGIVPALLLAAALTAACFGAFRGFELTDEAYYFLHYLYSRDFYAHGSFFGLYFEVPFRLLNGSVPGIRIFGVALLVSAAFYFSSQLYRFCSLGTLPGGLDRIAFLSTSMATALLYFSYLSTLRAPSYNTLVLTCMLISTGAMLAIVRSAHLGRRQVTTLFVYGAAISICAFTKAPAALFLLISHLAFFFVVNRNWDLARNQTIAAVALAGFATNVALVQLVFPGWLQVLAQGVEGTSLMGGHDLFLNLREFSWHMQKAVARDWMIYLFILASYTFLLWVAVRHAPGAINLLVVLVVIGLSALVMGSPRGFSIYPFLGLAVFVLFLTEFLAQRGSLLHQRDYAYLALIALLLTLPIGYSWGTSMPISSHSKMATIFPLAACLLLLQRLHARDTISRSAYLLSLTVLCVPPLWFQVAPWVALDHTYRLHAPLSEQSRLVSIGSPASSFLVDHRSQDNIAKLAAFVSSAGFTVGSTVLDLSGDGVGLVYAMGGKPLGSAWVLGGYPGSEKSLEYLLSLSDENTLRSAWLITSANNPHRIQDWRSILERKLKTFDYIPVGSVCLEWPYLPYLWSEAEGFECYDFTLWRPVGFDSADHHSGS